MMMGLFNTAARARGLAACAALSGITMLAGCGSSSSDAGNPSGVDAGGAGGESGAGGQGSDSSADGTSPQGDASSGPGGDCAATYARLCERGCACGGSAGCRFAITSDGGLGATYSWDTLGECKNFFAYACATSDAGSVDLPACAKAIEQVGCVSAMGGPALVSPPECNSLGK